MNKLSTKKLMTYFSTNRSFILLLMLLINQTSWSHGGPGKVKHANFTVTSLPLLISEFRLQGTFGPFDQYVEIYNNSDNPVIVNSSDGSSGISVAASDGFIRFVINNGVVIPARGHFLGANSLGYMIFGYPAGSGSTAFADASYSFPIQLNAGFGLFSTSNNANLTLATRIDAVGSTSEVNTLYKMGTGYPPLNSTFSSECCFHRKIDSGLPQNTNNNATDFRFEDTNGNSGGAGQSLGAPGPKNLSSPTTFGNGLLVTPAFPLAGPFGAPNFVRDFTSNPSQNSTFGTLSLRYKIKNVGGSPITRLRFRIDSITTFPAPSGTADLRALTSSPVSITLPSGTFTATTAALEVPPSQPNGGGFNSSLGVGTVTPGSPIAPGDSIFVNLLFGVQQPGAYTVSFFSEALPQAGGSVVIASRGNTECITPVVKITPPPPINICGSNPVLTASCGVYAFSGLLSGLNSVPQNITTASGLFYGIFNSNTNLINITVIFNGLTGGNVTAAHIHDGPPTANGPVIIPFPSFPSATSGTYTNVLSVPASEVAALLSGNCYVNIHNATFPGGEIRGQIPPPVPSGYSFSGPLSGTQAVPSNSSTGFGNFAGTYNAETNKLTLNLMFNNLNGGTASAAHIHDGAAGTNGPVIIPFTGFPATTSGTYSNTFTVPSTEISAFLSGNTYINIHNASFPGGEIRGQITAPSATCPSATYLWNTGATTPSITVTTPGTYTVTGSPGTACATTASVTIGGVSVTIPPVFAVNPGGIANVIYKTYGPQSLNLAANTSGGSATQTYNWSGPFIVGSTATATVNVAPPTPGTYTYTVTVNSNGCQSSATTAVKVYNISCGGNKLSLCQNSSNTTICLGPGWVPAYLGNGYMLGACGTITGAIFATEEDFELDPVNPVPGAAGGSYQNQFDVLVSPNPSPTDFKLVVTGTGIEPVQIKIMDGTGRLLTVMKNSTGTLFTVGKDYQAGTYFVQVIQGQNKKVVKLVKLN